MPRAKPRDRAAGAEHRGSVLSSTARRGTLGGVERVDTVCAMLERRGLLSRCLRLAVGDVVVDLGPPGLELPVQPPRGRLDKDLRNAQRAAWEAMQYGASEGPDLVEPG